MPDFSHLYCSGERSEGIRFGYKGAAVWRGATPVVQEQAKQAFRLPATPVRARGMPICRSVGQVWHLVGIAGLPYASYFALFAERMMMQKPGKAFDSIAEALKPQGNSKHPYVPQPELQLIYDTAPVGLAFLTPDCHYVQINQRLTEICGISVADHIGRSVRETVPQVADQVEQIVEAVTRTGVPITGVEVRGQRADKRNTDRVWITNWHPLKDSDGSIIGVNVVAEEIPTAGALKQYSAQAKRRCAKASCDFAS